MLSSIAFIPSVVILASLLMGVLVFYFEDYKYTRWLSKNLEFILVSGNDNARMILTTIVGGIISLTVFSFSMVMVVLNRTSDSLSPRLLPQLIAKKFHQVVLGFYMGTIVYSLILVISIGPDKNLPALGILISMIMAVSSLGLFIYFIHSISESIQVNNIMRGILNSSRKQIGDLDKKNHIEGVAKEIEKKFKYQIHALETGYYFHSPVNTMLKFLSSNNIKLRIEAHQGEFLIEGALLAVYYPEKQEEEYKEALQSFFYSSLFPDEQGEYFDNLRKISEIALKALSPGINDPGTARIALRFLTMLFEEVIRLPEYIPHFAGQNNLYVMEKLPSLECQLQDCIVPIRQCAGGFTEIILALFAFYGALLKKTTRADCSVLYTHIHALIQTADSSIKTAYDRALINEAIIKIKQMPKCVDEEIPLLEQ